MEGINFWIAAVLAAASIGLGKGGVPAISAMAVPILSFVISPVMAAGLLLPVFIISDVFGLYAYRRDFDRRVLLIMCVTMPLGVLLGYLTANVVSEGAVTIIVGLIGIVFALSMIFRRPVDGPPLPAQWGPGIFWGTITGFTSFVSHSGAPPFQVYTLPLRLTKLVFAGTVVISFAYINVVKLIPYWALGQLSLTNLKVAMVLVVPAVLSVWAGVWLVRVMPEKLFFRIIVWSLLAMSLVLVREGYGRL